MLVILLSPVCIIAAAPIAIEIRLNWKRDERSIATEFIRLFLFIWNY